MRQFLPKILLFIFLTNSIGHYLILSGTLFFWKIEVKKSIIFNTKEEDLVQIATQTKVKWLEENEEFELDNIRYDVVKTENNFYFCYQDGKETHLLKKTLSQIVQQQNDDNSDDFSILKNIFKIYFIENQYFIHLFFKINKVVNFQTLPFSNYYFFDFLKPPSVN